MARTILIGMLAIVAAIAIGSGSAAAAGGKYVFDGGTINQQAQVTAALNASSFPWSIVPTTITIHIAPGLATEATPANIWLDSNLVDGGRFAWGIIQHEYAHQVDFLLLDNATRAALLPILGGRAWCWESPGYEHEQYGCERFASTLAWSYWQSSDNSLAPQSPDDESASLTPKLFKTLLGRILQAQTGNAAAAVGAFRSGVTNTTKVALAPSLPARPTTNASRLTPAAGSR